MFLHIIPVCNPTMYAKENGLIFTSILLFLFFKKKVSYVHDYTLKNMCTKFHVDWLNSERKTIIKLIYNIYRIWYKVVQRRRKSQSFYNRSLLESPIINNIFKCVLLENNSKWNCHPYLNSIWDVNKALENL